MSSQNIDKTKVLTTNGSFKRRQFGWPYSEGIISKAVVLHQVEASDLVHVRIQRVYRGQESGPWPHTEKRKCKVFFINKQWDPSLKNWTLPPTSLKNLDPPWSNMNCIGKAIKQHIRGLQLIIFGMHLCQTPPCINHANQASSVHTGHTPGIKSSYTYNSGETDFKSRL